MIYYSALYVFFFYFYKQQLIMKFEETQLNIREKSYKIPSHLKLTQASENRQSTPDSLILENGNQTISSGYESSECGSTSNVLQTDNNSLEVECNHNTVLTEENLSRVCRIVCYSFLIINKSHMKIYSSCNKSIKLAWNQEVIVS